MLVMMTDEQVHGGADEGSTTRKEEKHNGEDAERGCSERVSSESDERLSLYDSGSSLGNGNTEDVDDRNVEDHTSSDKQDARAMIEEAAAAAAAAAAAGAVTHLIPQEVDAATAAALAVKTEEAVPSASPGVATVLDREDKAMTVDEEQYKRERERLEEESTNITVSTVSGAARKRLKRPEDREAELAQRRMKDRERYSNMNAEQRKAYNARRREQYHRQSEASRQRRRERERSRYHELSVEAAKERNARRAKLERERYQRLSPAELEARNRRRRERAAALRRQNSAAAKVSEASTRAKTEAGNSQRQQQLPEEMDRSTASVVGTVG